MEMFSLNNSNVFVSSLKKHQNHFLYNGNGSIADLNLLKLIYKYAPYCTSYESLKMLDSMASKLQLRNKLICINKIEAGGFYPDNDDPFGTGELSSANQPPTLNNGAVTLSDSDTTHTFTSAEFAVSFSDPDGDGAGNLLIVTLPATGTLTYDGTDVVAGQIISFTAPTLLTGLVYTRDGTAGYSDSFTFGRYDDNFESPALSAVKTMNVTVTALANTKATIGDTTVYADNAVTTILTQAVVAPSYSDPDGDALHSIRIDEVSDDNQGQFLYLGLPVNAGQIITAAELAAGDFTHVGPSVSTISTDTFTFSVRDTGSLIWSS